MTDDEALLLVAPELAAVPPDRRLYFLGVTTPRVRADLGQHAVALATAHALTLNLRAGIGSGAIAGPVISESEGQLSRTYANQTSGAAFDAYWSLTPYGAEYWALVRETTFGPRNRMM